MHGDHGIQHCAIKSILYLRTIKDKYIKMYNEFILHLHNYAKAIRILAKGYLPISLVTPLTLQEILTSVKDTLSKTNPDYNIVIKRLHLYYEMKLVTFSIDRKKKLHHSISNICATIHTTTFNFISTGNSSSTKTVIPVDKNTKAESYMQLQIKKPYIALNTKTHINIRQQELATCKKIGYEFDCKELL